MTEPNIVNNPIMDWTIREDGIVTIYFTDTETDAETRVLFPDFNGLSILNEVTEIAAAGLVIFHESGYDAVHDAIVQHLSERDLTVTEEDFNRLLDE